MRVLIALIVLLVSALAWAQPQVATPTSVFVLNQPAVDLAEAQSFTYRIYADGATVGTVAVWTCTGQASPFECETRVGAYTPGPHLVVYSASNTAGESEKSDPVPFTMTLVPGKPVNGRIRLNTPLKP